MIEMWKCVCEREERGESASPKRGACPRNYFALFTFLSRRWIVAPELIGSFSLALPLLKPREHLGCLSNSSISKYWIGKAGGAPLFFASFARRSRYLIGRPTKISPRALESLPSTSTFVIVISVSHLLIIY